MHKVALAQSCYAHEQRAGRHMESGPLWTHEWEIDKACLQVLCAQKDPLLSEHIHGDLCGRLMPNVLAQVKTVMAKHMAAGELVLGAQKA